MKTIRVSAGLMVILCGVLWAGPRDAEWKRVEEAREKDQPKTAIEILTGIEQAAFADEACGERAWPHAGKTGSGPACASMPSALFLDMDWSLAGARR